MSHDVKVLPIEPSHLDTLLVLCAEHAVYENADFREHGQVERWRSALFAAEPRLHGWIATDGGEPCGYMTATVDFATWSAAPFAYMDCLYLRESHRGLGLGRVFLDRLREFARANGCGWAEWQTPEDNALGIGFYRRMGATSRTKARFTYDVGERGGS
ncbi:GNAT family N-acetyltransferase [Actinosynnema sp. NPDC020468]|uniref:GNAT family N-acetyltransferase n=1 Tax=Actinosynnema sp. NPDC020468 TaxID=3154488 RepID=UPI0033CA9452